MELKELRKEKGLTQENVAKLLGVSLRSYKSYENDSNKKDSLKYNYFYEKLEQYNYLDEKHGILNIEDIKNLFGCF